MAKRNKPKAPSTTKPSSSGEAIRPLVQRTTVVLPTAMDANLELCALREGTSKGKLIQEMIARALIERGYKPYRMPKISNISYD